MRVVGRAVGSAALAGVLTITAFIIALAVSWISGWSLTFPGLLTVRRASAVAADGVVFDPNATGWLVLAGVLTIVIAAWSPASPNRARATGV